ncbi:unnamed protein product [Owenia fusiformis]|uniref:Uncharacterized protein n=1 Tax=Owenia fusiformis TaxID=6347 RepID=A0A8J1TW33_OWEFU|nr:unnamed protein product [Owenia fusiformis]
MRLIIILLLALYAISLCDAGKKRGKEGRKDKVAGKAGKPGKPGKGGRGGKEGKIRGKKKGSDSCPSDPDHQIYQTTSERQMCCQNNIIYMASGGPMYQSKGLNSGDMWKDGACDKSEDHIFKVYGINSCRCVKGDLCPADDSPKYRANGDDTITMCCKFNSQYYRGEGAKYKKLKLRRNGVKYLECREGEIFKIRGPHECGCEEDIKETIAVDQAGADNKIEDPDETIIRSSMRSKCGGSLKHISPIRLVARTINGKRYHVPQACLVTDRWFYICNKAEAYASEICKELNLCQSNMPGPFDCSNAKGEIVKALRGSNWLTYRVNMLPFFPLGEACQQVDNVLTIQCPIPFNLAAKDQISDGTSNDNEV